MQDQEREETAREEKPHKKGKEKREEVKGKGWCRGHPKGHHVMLAGHTRQKQGKEKEGRQRSAKEPRQPKDCTDGAIYRNSSIFVNVSIIQGCFGNAPKCHTYTHVAFELSHTEKECTVASKCPRPSFRDFLP